MASGKGELFVGYNMGFFFLSKSGTIKYFKGNLFVQDLFVLIFLVFGVSVFCIIFDTYHGWSFAEWLWFNI